MSVAKGRGDHVVEAQGPAVALDREPEVVERLAGEGGDRGRADAHGLKAELARDPTPREHERHLRDDAQRAERRPPNTR